MGTLNILLYLFGTVFFFSALMFAYYGFKTARLMRGGIGHQLMAIGGIHFIATTIIGAADHFFFPGSGLVYAEFLVWLFGLTMIVVGGVLRAKRIQRVYPVHVLRILTMMPHSRIYLIGISALVLVSLPVSLVSVLSPLRPEPRWFDVGNTVVWVLAFAIMAVAERRLFLAAQPSAIAMVGIEREMLLREDVLALRMFSHLVSGLFAAALPMTGIEALKDILSECADEYDILKGCAVNAQGTLTIERVVEALVDMSKEEGDSRVFGGFSHLVSRLVDLYSAVTSTGRAQEVVAENYQALRQRYGDTPNFPKILQAMPKGFLEEERLGLLTKEELGQTVRQRTKQLEEALAKARQATAALQASKASFHNIVEKSADGIIVVDRQGKVRFVNLAAESLLGIRAERFGDELPHLSLAAGEAIELEVIRTDGQEGVAELRVVETEWEGEVAYLALLRDITERKGAEEALWQRNRELALLNRASRVLTSILDLDQVLVVVLEEVRRLLGAAACSVWLKDRQTNELVCRQAAGPKSDIVCGWRLTAGEGLVGWVAHHGESLILPDVQTDERHFKGVDQRTGLKLRSILAVPLRAKQDVIGVLEVVDEKVDRFKPTDLALVEPLAATAAVAIENARLYQETDHLRAFNENIVHSMDEGVLIYDAHGNITFVNPQTADLTGYTREELVGRHWRDLVAPEYLATAEAEFAKRPQGISSRYELLALTKDGRRVPVIVSVRPLFDDGLFSGGLVVFTDITERVQAEHELKTRRTYLESVLAAAPDAIVTLNAHHQVVEWNPGAEKLFGYSSGEAIGQDLDRLITHSDVVEQAVGLTEAVMSGKSVGPVETVRYRKDGTVVNVIVAGSPIVMEDELTGVVAVYTDITERKRAEAALKKSEGEKAVILNSVSELVSFQNPELEIIWANGAAGRSVGLLPEQLVGRRCYDIWHQRDEPCEGCPVLRALETGRPEHKEMTTPDGREWFVRGYPVRGENGQVVGVVEVTLEITARKRAEKEIRRRAAHQEALNRVIATAAGAPDLSALLETALEHTLQALGLDMGGIWLWAADVVISRGFSPEIIPPILQRREEVASHLSGPIAREDLKQVAAADSSPLYLQIMDRFGIRASLTAPILAEGQSLGGLGVAAPEPRQWSAEEITLVETVGRQIGGAVERLRLLEKTQEQAHQVQQIVDTVAEGMLLLDAERRVVLANPLAREYLTVLADAGVGDTITRLGKRPLTELLAPPPQGLWHEVEIDEPGHRIFEVIARPMQAGPEPENEGWVLVVRDVTQERAIQQRAQQQERLASVGQLAAGIAHDFNNIMAVIVLYTQMALRNQDLPATVLERLTTVDRQAKRATDLIQQILDFSRRAVLERRPLDLLPFVKEQVKLLERTLPETIRLDLACEDDSFLVNADPTRMQQVFMNLALNSRDAMPKGGELRIGLEKMSLEPGEPLPLQEMEPGQWVRVTVADTGTGIPPDILPRIFEPFFTTKAPLGSGLGLAQVYGIVKQHEGHIDVNSRVGKGTTVVIYLPALPVFQPPVSKREAPTLVKGQGATILVVEDDLAAREALVDSLEMLDYRVLEATNGQEALTIFEQKKDEIALVLSDLVMPHMGGVELYRALRQQRPSVRIVVLTGYPLDTAEDLSSEGVVGWLQKPLSLEQLAQVVNGALEEG